MRLHLLVAVAPLVLIAGCATTPAAQQVAAGPPPAQTPYGMFLAGEAAMNAGHSADAARFFQQAGVDDEGQGGEQAITERAFTAALLAGEIDKAAALAPSGPKAPVAMSRLGKLVVAVKDIADGQGKQAQAELTPASIPFPHRGAAALLQPWAAAEAGDVEGSLVRPEVAGDPVVSYFGQLGQAMLFERARRYGEAETDYKAVALGPRRSEMAVLAYGAFLERRGRRKEAIDLYDHALSQSPTDSAIMASRARAAAGRPAPPELTVRQGAAQALLAPAAEMQSAKQNQFALIYARLALKLDPQRNEAWLMVGDIMSDAGDTAQSRKAYENVRAGTPDYVVAQSKLAWSYQNDGDKATALKLARAVAATGAVEGRLTLADLLRADHQYADSAQILTSLIQEAKAPDWRLLYARGAAYAEMERWPDAEADLKAALKLEPDQPELLNFLGYSWIDRGEHLAEALSMVKRAVASDPRSGAMVDSLGWAYYKLGNYKEAVQKLEEAVELEAGDPEINFHLGDAYWKVGRRDEAVFQWRRVLTLQPDAKIKSEAEAKLASYGPDGPPQKIAGE